MMKKSKNTKVHGPAERGIALFVAVIVSGILLLVAFSLSTIAFRELVISTSGRESQKAFYAADSGIECMLYWVNHGDKEFAWRIAQFNPEGGDGFYKGGPAIEDDDELSCGNDKITTQHHSDEMGDPPSEAGDGFFITRFDAMDIEGGACAYVEVERTVDEDEGWDSIVIRSRGYNNCETRTYERGIRIISTTQIDDEDEG